MRFPDYKGEWEVKRLGELMEFKNGINASKDLYGKGVKFINVLDILQNDFITHKKIVGLVDIENETFEKYSVTYGDILFQRSSETREEVGSSNVYLDQKETATFGGFVIRGKKIDDYAPVFLNKLLKTSIVRNQIISKSGGSTRYNVGQEVLASVEINIPDMSEQEKIASFLAQIEGRIQTQMKIIEGYKLLKHGMTQKIFQLEFRFNGTYSKWEKVKLREVLVEHKRKNTSGAIDEVFSVSKEKGIVNQIEHLGRSYAAESILHYKIAEPYDIVYTKSPTSNFPFGIIKQNQTGRTGVLSPLYGVFRPKNRWIGVLIQAYFLSWVNTYNYLNPLVHKGAKNTMNINNEDFLNGAKIYLPTSEQEQQKIAETLSAIDQKIELENQYLDLLKQQKQYLLQNMFV